MFLRSQKIDAGKLIKPMESQLFFGQNPKKRSKNIGKALPREGYRIAFSQRENLVKPMEKQLFQKSENANRKPYKNLGQMKEIQSKIAKGPPKTLKKP